MAAESVALKSLAALEAEHVQRVLDFTQGHKVRACKRLGISRPALNRKIEKYRLRWSGRTGMTESDSPSQIKPDQLRAGAGTKRNHMAQCSSIA